MLFPLLPHLISRCAPVDNGRTSYKYSDNLNSRNRDTCLNIVPSTERAGQCVCVERWNEGKKRRKIRRDRCQIKNLSKISLSSIQNVHKRSEFCSPGMGSD